MKFGQPILSSELSGSLSGVTASAARGGVGYFRTRARPGNPRSVGQTTARLILTGLAAAWRGELTAGERAAWEALAPADASGIDVYVKGNTPRLRAGVAREDVAPATLALAADPITATPTISVATDLVSFTIPAGNEDLARYNVFVSAPQGASRAARQFGYLYVGSTLASTSGATTVAIPATHPAAQGLAGQVVYVRLLPFGDETTPAQDGKVGVAQEFRVTLSA